MLEHPANVEKGMSTFFLWLVPAPTTVAFQELWCVDSFSSTIEHTLKPKTVLSSETLKMEVPYSGKFRGIHFFCGYAIFNASQIKFLLTRVITSLCAHTNILVSQITFHRYSINHEHHKNCTLEILPQYGIYIYIP